VCENINIDLVLAVDRLIFLFLLSGYNISKIYFYFFLKKIFFEDIE